MFLGPSSILTQFLLLESYEVLSAMSKAYNSCLLLKYSSILKSEVHFCQNVWYTTEAHHFLFVNELQLNTILARARKIGEIGTRLLFALGFMHVP